MNLNRRSLLKGLAAAAGGTVVGGAGLSAFSGSAFGVEAQIESNPVSVTNDRGDLQKVTIDPTLRVEWSGLDVAAGKVMILIEARTQEDGEYRTQNPATGKTWVPIFRATPWLTENMKQNGDDHIDYSKPGTTGHLEYVDPISKALHAAVYHRTGSVPSNVPRPIEVVNEIGMPDYGSLDYSTIGGVTMDSYLEGDSVGGAPGELMPVNHFPGAEAGLYGAAIDSGPIDGDPNDTDHGHFDVPTDGKTDADTVELRYTFALYTVNWANPGNLGSGWFENVRETDLQVSGSNGNSKLVMNGQDGYPDVRKQGFGDIQSESTNHYRSLQRMADEHPAVTVVETEFPVSVTNEVASSGTGSGGESGTGAQGNGS